MFNVNIPEIVRFVELVRSNKKINLDFSNDIRDLIKDVYKNVKK